MLLTVVSTMALMSVCLCVRCARTLCIIRQLLQWSCWLLLLLVMLGCEPSIVEMLKSVSVATYLVMMSAVLFAVLILRILARSCCTNCWMKRCLTSMCFAFFEDPILVAMLFPLEESVWILMFTLILSASCRLFHCF